MNSQPEKEQQKERTRGMNDDSIRKSPVSGTYTHTNALEGLLAYTTTKFIRTTNCNKCAEVNHPSLLLPSVLLRQSLTAMPIFIITCTTFNWYNERLSDLLSRASPLPFLFLLPAGHFLFLGLRCNQNKPDCLKKFRTKEIFFLFFFLKQTGDGINVTLFFLK